MGRKPGPDKVFRCDGCECQVVDKKCCKRCKLCGGTMLQRIYYMMPGTKELVRWEPEEEGPYIAIKLAAGEIKTLGHLAQRNTEKMSKDKLAELKANDPNQQRKQRLIDNAPWWRPGTTGPNRKVAKMTKKQQKKHIGD